MRTLGECNPLAAAIYFLAAAGIVMFCMDPVILCLSLGGSLLYNLVRNGLRGGRVHLYTLVLFLAMTLVNPLFNHNGVTVLFVMNHNPITLEALVYGAAAACMVVAVLYWFRSFSAIMTSDKLLYIFGALSPKLSLVLSMALRYVPLFGQQVKKVNAAQTALGLYKEDNIVDKFRGGLRIFSVMVTWALENGIVTADSMTARGYGIGKRSRFSLFAWKKDDVTLVLCTLLLAVATLVGISGREFVYYPAITASPVTLQALLGYAAYGTLALLPTLLEWKEAIKWRCLRSRI